MTSALVQQDREAAGDGNARSSVLLSGSRITACLGGFGVQGCDAVCEAHRKVHRGGCTKHECRGASE